MKLELLFVFILQLLILTKSQQQKFPFHGCDSVIPLQKEAFLVSPYYPKDYVSNSSCRYKIVAPLDHYIEANCNITFSSQTELFYIGTDGDLQIRNAEIIRDSASFQRSSLFRELTLAYISQGNKGKFKCKLIVKKQACSCGWSTNETIVNEKNASLTEFPSMVALKEKFSSHLFCAASIISHRYMLSAAYCFSNGVPTSEIVAIVGITNVEETKSRYGAKHDIEQVIIHPNYLRVDYLDVNDIALLRTVSNIEWSLGVGPICLPPLSKISYSFAQSDVDVIGWGTIFHDGQIANVLKKDHLKVIDNERCQADANGLFQVQASHMCTFDIKEQFDNSCSYDSGGPVILRSQRMFLLGCISISHGCGSARAPLTVNSRITSHLDWILQNSQQTTCVVDMP